MKAEVFPLSAIFEFARQKPHARVKHLVLAIKKRKLHDEMWLWWMQDQIGKIVDHNLAEGM